MSDLSNLPSQLAKVAATDYGKTVAPVLSQAATQLATTPAAAPAIGVAVLGSLGTAGVQIAADEVSALVTWTNAAVAKVATKIQTA